MRQACIPGFLKLLLSVNVCMRACVYVCVWYDMDPISLIKQALYTAFIIAAVVGIVSGCGFLIVSYCGNQPNKSYS